MRCCPPLPLLAFGATPPPVKSMPSNLNENALRISPWTGHADAHSSGLMLTPSITLPRWSFFLLCVPLPLLHILYACILLLNEQMTPNYLQGVVYNRGRHGGHRGHSRQCGAIAQGRRGPEDHGVCHARPILWRRGRAGRRYPRPGLPGHLQHSPAQVCSKGPAPS